MSKKYSKEYIDRVDNTIHSILNETREFSDWTQISLSVQQAVQAAANIWGISDDEAKHKMAGFIHELALSELQNIQKFDITYSKKSANK